MHLGVDERRAGEVLSEGERDEAEHGEAAVPELGVGAHDGAAPGLGAVPLQQRHQRRHGQHGGRGREPGQPGAAAGLREEAPAAGRLDGERGHEAHHGEPAVDTLGSRPAERQRVPQPGDRRLRLGRRRLLRWLNVLALRPHDQGAAARRERRRREGAGTTRAGGGQGEGGHGGHRRCCHWSVYEVVLWRSSRWLVAAGKRLAVAVAFVALLHFSRCRVV